MMTITTVFNKSVLIKGEMAVVARAGERHNPCYNIIRVSKM